MFGPGARPRGSGTFLEELPRSNARIAIVSGARCSVSRFWSFPPLKMRFLENGEDFSASSPMISVIRLKPLAAMKNTATSSPFTCNRLLVRGSLTAALLVGASSCIQPPPPRTYHPKVASHLRQISHDTPVTPVPSSYGGWGYNGYHPYYGY